MLRVYHSTQINHFCIEDLDYLQLNNRSFKERPFNYFCIEDLVKQSVIQRLFNHFCTEDLSYLQ